MIKYIKVLFTIEWLKWLQTLASMQLFLIIQNVFFMIFILVTQYACGDEDNGGKKPYIYYLNKVLKNIICAFRSSWVFAVF